MNIKKECEKQRRAAQLISIPFVFLAMYSILTLRGDTQILWFLFFMAIFFMFFGMFLAYEGVLKKLKVQKN